MDTGADQVLKKAASMLLNIYDEVSKHGKRLTTSYDTNIRLDDIHQAYYNQIDLIRGDVLRKYKAPLYYNLEKVEKMRKVFLAQMMHNREQIYNESVEMFYNQCATEYPTHASFLMQQLEKTKIVYALTKEVEKTLHKLKDSMYKNPEKLKNLCDYFNISRIMKYGGDYVDDDIKTALVEFELGGVDVKSSDASNNIQEYLRKVNSFLNRANFGKMLQKFDQIFNMVDKLCELYEVDKIATILSSIYRGAIILSLSRVYKPSTMTEDEISYLNGVIGNFTTVIGTALGLPVMSSITDSPQTVNDLNMAVIRPMSLTNLNINTLRGSFERVNTFNDFITRDGLHYKFKLKSPYGNSINFETNDLWEVEFEKVSEPFECYINYDIAIPDTIRGPINVYQFSTASLLMLAQDCLKAVMSLFVVAHEFYYVGQNRDDSTPLYTTLLGRGKDESLESMSQANDAIIHSDNIESYQLLVKVVNDTISISYKIYKPNQYPSQSGYTTD
ncbi:hypothetical protein RCL1_006228 [Eukaryota sp. TZLM3-RCL]